MERQNNICERKMFPNNLFNSTIQRRRRWLRVEDNEDFYFSKTTFCKVRLLIGDPLHKNESSIKAEIYLSYDNQFIKYWCYSFEADSRGAGNTERDVIDILNIYR